MIRHIALGPLIHSGSATIVTGKRGVSVELWLLTEPSSITTQHSHSTNSTTLNLAPYDLGESEIVGLIILGSKRASSTRQAVKPWVSHEMQLSVSFFGRIFR